MSRMLCISVFWAIALLRPFPVVAGDISPKPHLSGVRVLPLSEIGDLKQQLGNLDSLAKAPKTFFKDAFDPDLADLILYVSGTGESRKVVTGMVKDLRGNPKLWGERNLWVIVFMEGTARALKGEGGKAWVPRELTMKEKPDSAAMWAAHDRDVKFGFEKKSPTLGIRFEPLDSRRSFAQTTAFNVLGLLLGKYESKPVTQTLKDEEREAQLIRIEKADTSQALFVAREKFSLEENTKNRVRVTIDDSLSAYSTFGNYSSSRIGVGVGMGLSVPAHKSATKDDLRMVPFAMFKWWMPWRPESPYIRDYSRPFGLGLFSGFRISSEPFHDIVVGLSAGQLMGGPVGLFSGAHFARADSVAGWSTRWVAGVDYAL